MEISNKMLWIIFFASIVALALSARYVFATSFTCTQNEKELVCDFPKEIETAINKISDTSTGTSIDIAKISSDISKSGASVDSILQRTFSIEQILDNIQSKATMTMHGTEYKPNDNGTVFLQLVNGSGYAINNALCSLTIYYPNKTIFKNNVEMMYLSNSDGLYYYDLVIPNALGIYMISSKCNFYYNLTYSTSSKDAWINQGLPTTNYGNDTVIAVGNISGNSITSYIQFTNPTMGSIDEAYLFLYKAGSIGSGLGVELYRVTSYWNESNITWNNQPSRNGYIWDRKIMNANGWYSWNITNLLKMWANGTYPNYGMYLNYSSPTGGGVWNFTSYYSREYGGDYVPKLFIQYSETNAINEIRGGGEIHVSSSADVNYTYFNREFNDTNNLITSVNNNMGNNFTYTNSLITTLINAVNYTINYWGNALETKLDNLIIGNVTINANVDYDRIAITVVQYFRGLGFNFPLLKVK
jgi:hypothetical protein